MGGVELKRLALNKDQIQKYKPPPNPAKVTDSRAKAYIAEFGRESWELDALEPKVLVDLVRKAILSVRDHAKWEERQDQLSEEKALLEKAYENWPKIAKGLEKNGR